MLGAYAISLMGDSHRERGDAVCQDASAQVALPDGRVALLVADGVGSAARSDEGAALAVATASDVLVAAAADATPQAEMPVVLESAFASALGAILEKARAERVHPSAFDTTLTVAVHDGRSVAYGHVGDGGIIALTSEGRYRTVTSPMKGEEFNQVVPLRGGKNAWEFGVFEEPTCAVLCATDGIYDVCCPWLLADQDVDVYVAFVRPFMDNALLKLTDAAGIEALEGAVRRYLASDKLPQVSDDKTVAVCIDLQTIPAVQDEAYYALPDWAALHEAKVTKLYDAPDGTEGEAVIGKANEGDRIEAAEESEEPERASADANTPCNEGA